MVLPQPYQFRCTLTFGDIYAQIIVWLLVIFVSLAAGLALMGAHNPIFALVVVGMIFVLSLPFLLFAFILLILVACVAHLRVQVTRDEQLGVPVDRPVDHVE